MCIHLNTLNIYGTRDVNCGDEEICYDVNGNSHIRIPQLTSSLTLHYIYKFRSRNFMLV